MDILKQLKGVRENVSLAQYTTFKIGGPARYFFIARTNEDLIKAIKAAKKFKIPLYVLGGGSNVLVSDKGFDGLVVKILDLKLKVPDLKIIAGAGVALSAVVGKSIEAGLTGLEWAAGIHGTVGGAIRGNAGAFGEAMDSVVAEVKTVNQEGKTKIWDSKKCQFGYRSSIFKKNNDIIIEVVLKLKKGDKKKSKEMIASFLRQRKEKQPLEYPSAGSVFKNADITRIAAQINADKRIPEEFKEKKIIPAGWLIEEVELKGKRIGGAIISDKHANFIINAGGATASDVLQLISLAKMRVRDIFGIQLEEEIEYLGF